MLRVRSRTLLSLVAVATVVSPSDVPLCGNGFRTINEECDDGNLIAGDGCSPACRFEDPCGCISGEEFLCEHVTDRRTGEEVTVCCATLRDPFTDERVCDCKSTPNTLAGTWVDPKTCTWNDVNECMVANGGCLPNAKCINKDARVGPDHSRYECRCDYHGDGVSSCDPIRYTVAMILLVQNETVSSLPLNVTDIHSHVSAYVTENNITVKSVTVLETLHQESRRRQLLQVGNGYDHYTVVFDVGDWDTMQELTTTLNANLVAEHISNATGGLNQVSVLQEATASVEESEVEFTVAQLTAPGFLMHNFSYGRIGGEYTWEILSSFFAPPGVTYVFFASKSHDGYPLENHPCTANTDLCCLVRMKDSHYMGDFEDWITSTISPLCDPATKELLPEHASTTSESILSTIPKLDWLEGSFAHTPTSTVSIPSSPLDPNHRMGDVTQMQITINNNDVAKYLARTTSLPNSTQYEFAIGMLFIKGLSVPEMYSAVGQTRLMVQAANTLGLVVSTAQDYSFLTFQDMSFLELQYWPYVHTAHRLQFVRVVAVVPSTISNAQILNASIQFAVSKNISTLSQQEDPWTNPCFSGINDGSGPWDPAADSTVRDLHEAAAAQQCAMRDIGWCTTQTASFAGGDTILTFDIPLGGEALTEATLIAGNSLFIRMLVQGMQDGSKVLTQASNQITVSPSTVMRLCEPPLSSVLKDTDYVSVSLSVGTSLEPIDTDEREAVVFNDITNSQDYNTLKALDVSDTYTAVSVLDSILTVALLGAYNFFNSPGNTAYSVEIDHILLVHIRNDAKYETIRSLVTNGTAVTVSRDAYGYGIISTLPELDSACNTEADDDCAVTHPIYQRNATNGLAQPVKSTPEDELVWILKTFGDTHPMRQVATEFVTDSRTQFGFNYRYRRGWYVIPTYPWPVSKIGLVDRTIMFVSFSVDRHL